MERRGLQLLTVVAIAAGAASACDRPTAVTSPTGLSPRAATVTGYYSDGYILLTATGSSSQTKSLVLDENGGKINMGPNSLVIPYKAVSGPTQFVFTLQSSPYIAAKLTAYEVTAAGKNKWIQGPAVTTFAKALTLTLSYAQSNTPIPDPNQLKIGWIRDGKVLEIQQTTVDAKGQKLVADIKHFSEYGPVTYDPNSPFGQN